MPLSSRSWANASGCGGARGSGIGIKVELSLVVAGFCKREKRRELYERTKKQGASQGEYESTGKGTDNREEAEKKITFV